MPKKTRLSIQGEDFLINDQPTYAGRSWEGTRVEGMLFNTRMVCATFDDLNLDTRDRWAYPDTGTWDPDRNTDEFIAQLASYKQHGVLMVTLCFQHGAPGRYVRQQPWHSSAFTAYGELRPEHQARMKRVMDAVDELGMVAGVGYFYFGQDGRVLGEESVRRAVDSATNWLLDEGYTNVLVDVANECDVPRYQHDVLKPPRVHELIQQVKENTRDGRRLLVGTSFTPGSAPTAAVVAESDVVILHGNGCRFPGQLTGIIHRARAVSTYRPMPVLINEDDNFAFDRAESNLRQAARLRVSWGYYDNGPGTLGSLTMSNYQDGFQNPPINWAINSDLKRGFFNTVKSITGA